MVLALIASLSSSDSMRSVRLGIGRRRFDMAASISRKSRQLCDERAPPMLALPSLTGSKGVHHSQSVDETGAIVLTAASVTTDTTVISLQRSHLGQAAAYHLQRGWEVDATHR